MRDDDLVAKFFEALKAAGQDHIVRLLDAGLHTFVALLIIIIIIIVGFVSTYKDDQQTLQC